MTQYSSLRTSSKRGIVISLNHGFAMTAIAEWLASIGLSEYAARFVENAIDLSVVGDLTEQDLKDLGLPLGHRRKMLRAIGELTGTVFPPAQAVAKPAPREEPQRRQITVMFCDLVGSSALSARLDPEDLRAVIGSYLACIAEIITQDGGVIARYMGDGVLAYFGFPQAHEDDAEQAILAGLALVNTVANLKTDIGTALTVRVGIATGTVVVGDLTGEGAAKEEAVIGETPNLAARLQALAMPGTVLICESTRRLTEGNFEYRDVGPAMLKGWPEPLPAWEVLRTSGVENPLRSPAQDQIDASDPDDEEIDLLLRRWRNAMGGEGSAVVLTGEPGIGKSHIALALEDRLKETGQTAHRATLFLFSASHQQWGADRFHPPTRTGCGVRASRLARYEIRQAPSFARSIRRYCREDRATSGEPAVVACRQPPPTAGVSPQKRKEITLTALLMQLNALAAHQPVFVAFEDAHWADPTSLELLR